MSLRLHHGRLGSRCSDGASSVGSTWESCGGKASRKGPLPCTFPRCRRCILAGRDLLLLPEASTWMVCSRVSHWRGSLPRWPSLLSGLLARRLGPGTAVVFASAWEIHTAWTPQTGEFGLPPATPLSTCCFSPAPPSPVPGRLEACHHLLHPSSHVTGSERSVSGSFKPSLPPAHCERVSGAARDWRKTPRTSQIVW